MDGSVGVEGVEEAEGVGRGRGKATIFVVRNGLPKTSFEPLSHLWVTASLLPSQLRCLFSRTR